MAISPGIAVRKGSPKEETRVRVEPEREEQKCGETDYNVGLFSPFSLVFFFRFLAREIAIDDPRSATGGDANGDGVSLLSSTAFSGASLEKSSPQA